MASINILPKTVEEYCCPILCSQGDARINNPNPDEPIRISKTRVNILFSTTASFSFIIPPHLPKVWGIQLLCLREESNFLLGVMNPSF